MPRRKIHVTGAPGSPLRAALSALRTELGIPAGFPPKAQEEAERAAKAPTTGSYDATDIPFFTLDPPAHRPPPSVRRSAARPPMVSTGPGRATHLSRRSTGYRVRCAVADIAAFVAPGGPLDAETHRRVNTLRFPDQEVPLHPAVLSQGAACLLPDRTRPAVLWTIDLDASGRTVAVDVRRALVRSRAGLDCANVQKEIDAGTAEGPVALLKEIGEALQRLEAERGGVSLNVPELEINENPAGGKGTDTYEPSYHAPLPADSWDAQLSLLTGMAAASLMLDHGTGILRTLPAAPGGAVARLRRTATALHIDWPHHVSYAALIRGLDPHDPRHAAFLQECTTLLRAARSTPFRDGVPPAITTHAAVAAPYAHCTAPLSRLADRYASEICLAAVAGRPVPGWVLAALDALPRQLAEGSRRAGAVDRECADLVAAALLKDRVGDVFEGCVVDADEHQPTVGTVQLESPAVAGRVEGERLPLGERLRVRLVRADPGTAKVLFRVE
ncbi:RNB domain-containing ribonuclease [Streptomyces pluripotens]|uniref:RNB domain-containing ribonuclease n=1 Tax=Streptomyces pluripotens TaxID=1355015 RepID=A0A221NXI8_9ACTN|nr:MULTISPECIES: RNB domain-containing ribonuclease [Streptomyces]ARP69977.1 ribonuclease II [Streptomyces pluripotens]ASN24235.1 RNB domain-containing ribonuclease [Streptomyces pluripotens]KIE25269.1 ribonuclease II [Streptomyces sp. MUSC 125]MCH0560003.1 RNB domain-containing ribonuclease [Streptomyces sp. MUM 16J]